MIWLQQLIYIIIHKFVFSLNLKILINLLIIFSKTGLFSKFKRLWQHIPI